MADALHSVSDNISLVTALDFNYMTVPSPNDHLDVANSFSEIGVGKTNCIPTLNGEQSPELIGSEIENCKNQSVFVTNIQAEFWGTSCDTLLQSHPEDQGASMESFTLTESKSDISINGNLSDSLSPRLSDTDASQSPNFYSEHLCQVSSSTEDVLAENQEMSSPGASTKDWKQNALRYPPCAVCTGKSSGLHYGSYTCEACKNFFRRYLLRTGGFSCKKNNNCTISNRSRGNCSGCRLKKCLEVGMSKEKSKIGRYTHSQRTETIREVNKLEGKLYVDDLKAKQENSSEILKTENLTKCMDGTEERMPVYEPFNNCEALTESEKELIDILNQSIDAIDHFGEKGRTPEGRKQIIDEHYDRYLAKVQVIGPLRAIPKDEYFTLLKLYNIDLDGRWTLFKQEANNCAHIVERYCNFAYKIPGFKSVNLKDQEALLKVGHCEFFVILMHEGYDHEKQIYLEMNGVPAHIEEAADKIFSRKLIEMQAEIFSRWQKANLMKEEKTLLCAMSLVCSDRVDLENPTAVEKIHSELTDLLMKILQINHGKNAKKRFSKFIDILTFCRQASDAYFKEYQEMSQFDMIQEVAPAFPTLCPEKF